MICSKCGSELSKNGTGIRAGEKVQKWRCKNCGYQPTIRLTEKIDKPVEKTTGMTEDQFRGRFDLRFIIEGKCKELRRGVYLSMSEFVKFCGITPGVGYREIMLHPDYESYRGKVKGEIYWSHPESILKMKGEGILI